MSGLTLAACGAASGVDAGGFTGSDIKAATAALRALAQTSVWNAAAEVTFTNGNPPASCSFHIAKTSPLTFELFMTWVPDPAQGAAPNRRYAWLQAEIGPEGLKSSYSFHLGYVPTAHALASRVGDAFARPAEGCLIEESGTFAPGPGASSAGAATTAAARERRARARPRGGLSRSCGARPLRRGWRSLNVPGLVLVLTILTFHSAARPAVGLATTAPSSHYQALVKFTSAGIKLFEFIGYNDAPEGDLVPTTGPIPRGDNMSFTIVNLGKRTQDFTILGQKTTPIRPGRQGAPPRRLSAPGLFPYGSTLDKAAAFHGVIKVY